MLYKNDIYYIYTIMRITCYTKLTLIIKTNRHNINEYLYVDTL